MASLVTLRFSALLREDVEAVVEMDRLNMSGILAAHGQPYQPDERRAGIDRRTQAGINRFLVVKNQSGRIEGYIEYSVRAEGYLRVHSIQVRHPGGFSRTLVRLLSGFTECLNDYDGFEVRSDVFPSNQASLALHDRLGFERRWDSANLPSGQGMWRCAIDGGTLRDGLAALVERFSRSAR